MTRRQGLVLAALGAVAAVLLVAIVLTRSDAGEDDEVVAGEEPTTTTSPTTTTEVEAGTTSSTSSSSTSSTAVAAPSTSTSATPTSTTPTTQLEATTTSTSAPAPPGHDPDFFYWDDGTPYVPTVADPPGTSAGTVLLGRNPQGVAVGFTVDWGDGSPVETHEPSYDVAAQLPGVCEHGEPDDYPTSATPTLRHDFPHAGPWVLHLTATTVDCAGDREERTTEQTYVAPGPTCTTGEISDSGMPPPGEGTGIDDPSISFTLTETTVRACDAAVGVARYEVRTRDPSRQIREITVVHGDGTEPDIIHPTLACGEPVPLEHAYAEPGTYELHVGVLTQPCGDGGPETHRGAEGTGTVRTVRQLPQYVVGTWP